RAREVETDIESGIINPADFEPATEPGATPPNPASVAPPPSSSGLPSRDDLLLGGLANIPELVLSLHVYDDLPANRFAYINGQRVQEGVALPNGVRVETITPTGVVMSWQGRRFLLPLQN
ncbi:MAG: general secretion pathway protein GspB, partial [Steroidobacteraceae bacterium]|nr:general secretion pathway protein GspB [Steroidobacteraceae bacterium]